MSNILAVTYDGSVAVTKSDTVGDPLGPFAGLIVTVAGAVTLTDVRGGTLTLSTTTVGQIIPIATQRVWSTGTAATVQGLLAQPFRSGTPNV